MKNYFLRGNRIWCKAGNDEGGNWKDEPTVFIQIHGKLACGKCREILGKLTDSHIESNSEYHACSIERPLQKDEYIDKETGSIRNNNSDIIIPNKKQTEEHFIRALQLRLPSPLPKDD